MPRKYALALTALLASTTASAVDLLSVYQKALTADPTMQQAEQLYKSTRLAKPQAILNMLPVTLSAGQTWNGVQGGPTYTGPGIGTVGASVNLFSWDRWIALKQADKTVAQGAANFQLAQQLLIQRVAQSYFAVLQSEDSLAAQQSALTSSQRSLERAERLLEVGSGTVTDVQIARADRDQRSAAVIAAKRTLASAVDQLRAVTGERYERLAAPRENMPLLSPDPASEDAWVSTALAQNASLIASRMSADISQDQYLGAMGGYIPNVTVNASRNWLIHGDNPPGLPTTVNTNDVVWSIGVSLPINIGGTQLGINSARYLRNAARSGYEQSLRNTELAARDNYQAVISQIAQVQALQQAVASSKISLEAIEVGYEVGTKTALDVLNARANLVSSQTSYAQAKYGYLNSLVGLHLAAGNLDRTTVEQINGWLAERAPLEPATLPEAPPAAPAGTPATGPTPPPATTN